MASKLTKAQAKVIILLQKGEIITHDDVYFQVTEGTATHRISWKVWHTLTQELGLIQQELEYPFYFLLTKKGRELKFRPIKQQHIP